MIFCFWPGSAMADERLDHAAALYYQNRFAEARGIYEELGSECPDCFEIDYNLGNIYYREGDIGRALVHYERAVRRAPRSSDLQANLDFARAQRMEPLDVMPPRLKLMGDILFWGQFLTLGESFLVLVVLTAAFWLLAWCHLVFHRRLFRPLWIGMVLLSFVSALNYFQQWYAQTQIDWAVIVQSRTPVYATYLETDQPLAIVQPGSRLPVRTEQGFGDAEKWLQVELPGGRTGWIAEGHAEII